MQGIRFNLNKMHFGLIPTNYLLKKKKTKCCKASGETFVLGKYKFDELHRNGLKKYREYGPIVREEIVPGTNIVWIFTPEDVQELLRKEGRYPQRRSHLALEHYRKKQKDLYNNGGLLPTLVLLLGFISRIIIAVCASYYFS